MRSSKALALALVLACTQVQAQLASTGAGGASGGAPAPTCDATGAWVPSASGVKASLAFDFTTEGSGAANAHYWYNSTCYTSFSAIVTALGGTYSRAATTNGAWYTASTGLLASAATNVARFNYNPTGPANIGLLLEGGATNLALWSRDLTQSGTWIATTMTTAQTSAGADGAANSATRLTATALLATILQTPGLTSAARTYSVYIRRVTGSGTIKLTVDGTTFGSDLSGSLNNSTYTRVSATQTVIPIIGIQIGTSGDAIDVDFNQLESGAATAVPTSPIMTTTTTVARAPDSLTWPVPFTGWSTTVGSVVDSFVVPIAGFTSQTRPMAFSDGTTANRIVTTTVLTTGTSSLLATVATVVNASLTNNTFTTTAYATNKLGVAFTADDFASIVNGGTPVAQLGGGTTLPTGINLAAFGTAGAGTTAAGIINIKTWNYWPSRVTNTDLQTLTSP